MIISHIFLKTDMRCGFDGLNAYAKSKKVDLKKLAPLSCVLFINSQKNKIKVIAYNGVLSYLRSNEHNRPFDLATISEFPKAFGASGHVDYKKAIEATLIKLLVKKERFKIVKPIG